MRMVTFNTLFLPLSALEEKSAMYFSGVNSQVRFSLQECDLGRASISVPESIQLQLISRLCPKVLILQVNYCAAVHDFGLVIWY